MIQFKHHTDLLAEVTVEGSGQSFTLTQSGRVSYGLGFPDAPLFTIEHGFAPDHPWSIVPLEGGRLIGDQSAELERGLASWIPERHVTPMKSVLSSLPSGAYFLIRYRAEPDDATKVFLGNDLLPDPPPYLRALCETDRYYAGLVGRTAGVVPDTSAPLVGLSILNFTGNTIPRAALFFECMAAVPADAGVSDEMLLVLPRSGPLVFDTMSGYSGHATYDDVQAWDDTYADPYARRIVAKGREWRI